MPPWLLPRRVTNSFWVDVDSGEVRLCKVAGEVSVVAGLLLLPAFEELVWE